MASATVSALKKIQANTVRPKVATIEMNSLPVGRALPAATMVRLRRLVFIRTDGRIYSAFSNPQTTKVQLAPCQKPLTRKMRRIFLIFFATPPLLPPRGM